MTLIFEVLKIIIIMPGLLGYELFQYSYDIIVINYRNSWKVFISWFDLLKINYNHVFFVNVEADIMLWSTFFLAKISKRWHCQWLCDMSIQKLGPKNDAIA